MIIPLQYSADSFVTFYRQFGPDPQKAFTSIALTVSVRFFQQVEVRAPSDAYISKMLTHLWESLHAEGLPEPLGPKEVADTPELDYDYYADLVEELLAKLPRNRVEDSLRILAGQFYAALLAREFKTCRLSYQEQDSTGACVRQSEAHCLERISGSHCEDCPYYTALSSAQHQKLFKKAWLRGEAPTPDQLKVFLPEDFRALRIFWYLYIRSLN